MMKNVFKQFKGGPGNFIAIAAICFAALLLMRYLVEFSRTTHQINYTAFEKLIEEDKVRWVGINGTDVTGQYRDSSERFEVTIHSASDVLPLLRTHNVAVAFGNPSSDLSIWHLLLLFLTGLTVVLLWYLFRQAKRGPTGGGSTIFGMGKSKAKMFMPSQVKVNFNSVAGVHEAKEELSDVVDFLRNPEKYRRIGAEMTRGVLLIGAPGNGKTLLAKAVAGEANCPFFSISGSDFIEVFVGVGAARVRDLFAQARSHSPSIIFIDEIDAVGRQRGSGLGGGHDEREQTLNQLLTEMDGFDSGKSSVIVIAATNRYDVLDKALLRPGRFDRKVHVPYPDLVSREEILKLHMKGVKMDPAINANTLARGTPGFTGADLKSMINEAAIHAVKHERSSVAITDLDEASDKLQLGKKWKTVLMNDHEKRVTAYHEAGHTLMRVLQPDLAEPIHKVTIIPRGFALGVTHALPDREKYIGSKEEMEAEAMVALGGRAAEQLVFSLLGRGARSDFEASTQLIRDMVCLYGMSSELGQVVYKQGVGEYQYSEATAQKIDDEVRSVSSQLYRKVLAMLQEHRDKLDQLSDKLIEKETLHAEEIYEIVGVVPPNRDKVLRDLSAK